MALEQIIISPQSLSVIMPNFIGKQREDEVVIEEQKLQLLTDFLVPNFHFYVQHS